MSQQQSFGSTGTPGAADIEFVEGNTGGPVPPDPGTHILFLIGDTTQGVHVDGNAGTFTQTITADDATTLQKGVVLLADNAEALAGVDTTKAMTPDDVQVKVGTQTLNGLAYGAGSAAAIQWLGEAADGQIPIGDTGGVPILANLTSTDGSITITNGPGTIDLAANPGTGANYVQVNTAMTPYVVAATDYFISCDSSAGDLTIQLPNAPTASREFVIKDRVGASGTALQRVIVTTVGGVVTIDGATSYTFTDNYESLEIIFNGSEYEVF